MRRAFFFFVISWACFVTACYAANTHGLRSEQRERQSWFGSAWYGYVVSGCSPAVPASGLTIAAFACTGYALDTTNTELVYVDQPAQAITIADATPTWLAIRWNRAATPAGWTTVAGSHYIYRQATSQPQDPDGALVFAKVTVAASNITAIADIHPGSGHRHGWYDVMAPIFGGLPNTGTDQSSAIQAAIDMACANGGGVVYLARGTWTITTMLDLDDTDNSTCVGLTLRGAGPDSTIISVSGAIKGMDYSPASLQEARLHLHDFRLIGTNANALDLITIDQASTVMLHRIHVRNTSDDCIVVNNIHQWSIVDSRIEDCTGTGLEVGANAAVWSIINSDFNVNTVGTQHIELSSGFGTIAGSNFEGASTVTSAIIFNSVGGLTIQNNFFELYTGSVFAVVSNPSLGIEFLYNHISGAGAQMIDFSNSSLAHQNIRIIGNRFTAVGGSSVLFDPGSATVSFEFCYNNADATPSAYVASYNVAITCVYSDTTGKVVESRGGVARDDNAGTWRYDGQIHIGTDANYTIIRTSDQLDVTAGETGDDIDLRPGANNTIRFDATGGITFDSASTFTNATLPTLPNGSLIFCSDCDPTSATCAGSSTGAIAKRLNNGWDCR